MQWNLSTHRRTSSSIHLPGLPERQLEEHISLINCPGIHGFAMNIILLRPVDIIITIIIIIGSFDSVKMYRNCRVNSVFSNKGSKCSWGSTNLVGWDDDFSSLFQGVDKQTRLRATALGLVVELDFYITHMKYRNSKSGTLVRELAFLINLWNVKTILWSDDFDAFLIA